MRLQASPAGGNTTQITAKAEAAQAALDAVAARCEASGREMQTFTTELARDASSPAVVVAVVGVIPSSF